MFAAADRTSHWAGEVRESAGVALVRNQGISLWPKVASARAHGPCDRQPRWNSGNAARACRGPHGGRSRPHLNRVIRVAVRAEDFNDGTVFVGVRYRAMTHRQSASTLGAWCAQAQLFRHLFRLGVNGARIGTESVIGLYGGIGVLGSSAGSLLAGRIELTSRGYVGGGALVLASLRVGIDSWPLMPR